MSWIAVGIVLLLQDNSITELIQRLRSDKIEERSEAAGKLRKLGEIVIPYLETITKDPDTELARAAKEIIREIRDPLYAETAAETLGKMAAKLRDAKTISVKFRYTFVHGSLPPKPDQSSSISLMLKMPDKVRYEYQPASGTGGANLQKVVSDGKTVLGDLATKAYPPLDFYADSITGLCTYGVVLALSRGAATRMGAEDPVDGRIEETIEVSNIALMGQDPLGRKVTYEIRHKDGSVVDATLWCDLKTRLPRKRIISSRGKPEEIQQFIEVYEDWRLDIDMPEDNFNHAEKKQ